MKTLRKSFLLSLPVLALAAAPAWAEGVVNPAHGWDRLWEHVLIDLFIIGIFFGLLAVYFLIRYRAKGPNDVGKGPKLTAAQAVSWALLPAALFMADDFFLAANGWSLFSVYRAVPADALEIKVTGYQWYWEFDYGNGVVTQELHVPVGKPVVLRMTGADVIHSFALADYRVKVDVAVLKVESDKPLKTVVTCSMYCGQAHSKMYADVVAVPAEEYHAWLENQTRHAQAANNGSKG